MKPDLKKDLERGIFIALIVLLTFYGLKDIDAAEKLIRALTDAFSILFNTLSL